MNFTHSLPQSCSLHFRNKQEKCLLSESWPYPEGVSALPEARSPPETIQSATSIISRFVQYRTSYKHWCFIKKFGVMIDYSEKPVVVEKDHLQ